MYHIQKETTGYSVWGYSASGCSKYIVTHTNTLRQAQAIVRKMEKAN